jgi:hypothetical protein
VFLSGLLFHPLNTDYNSPFPKFSLVAVNTRGINYPNNRAYKMLVAETVFLIYN